MRTLLLLLLLTGMFLILPAHADIAEPPHIYVEGYASQSSYVPGDEAVFHISTGAPVFAAVIERVGLTRKKVWEKKDLPGRHNPVPDDASANGCHWPESFRVKIGADWPTGYYEMTLQAQDRGGRWSRRGTRTAQGSL